MSGIKQSKAMTFDTCYKQSKVEFTHNTTVEKNLPYFVAYKRELRHQHGKGKWRGRENPTIYFSGIHCQLAVKADSPDPDNS